SAATAFSSSAEDPARLVGAIVMSTPAVNAKARAAKSRSRSRATGTELSPRRSAFLSVVQAHPVLNIVPITQTRSFPSCCQLVARFIPPAAFGKKGIPDGNFFFARLSAPGKEPFEYLPVRLDLKSALAHIVR